MSFSDSRSATSSNIIQPRRLSRGTKRKNSEKFSNQVATEEDDNRFDQLAAAATDDSLLLMSNEIVDLFSGDPNTKSFGNTNNVTPAHQLPCPDEKMREEAQVQQALFVSMQQHKAEKVQEESQLQQALLMSKQQQTVIDHLLSEQQLQKSRFEELESKVKSIPKKQLPAQTRKKKARTMSRQEELTEEAATWASSHVNANRWYNQEMNHKKKCQLEEELEVEHEGGKVVAQKQPPIVAPIIHQKQPPIVHVDAIPKPKKANNAFFIYMNANRARIMEKNPTFTQPEFVSLSVMGCLFVFAMFFPHTDSLCLYLIIYNTGQVHVYRVQEAL